MISYTVGIFVDATKQLTADKNVVSYRPLANNFHHA